MRHVASLLTWGQKRDDNLSGAAALASQAILDLSQREGVAQVLT
jgi:hypothetical protein